MCRGSNINSKRVHPQKRLCITCIKITPSDIHPNIPCVICQNEFMSHNNTQTKCYECHSTNKCLCTVCGVAHTKRFNSTKCAECDFKDYPCKVCGDHFSTVPIVNLLDDTDA